MRVSAEDFREAFAEQWREDVEERENDILTAYPYDRQWTDYMPGPKKKCECDKNVTCEPCRTRRKSFLGRLSERLSLTRSMSEWLNIDVVYYDRKQLLSQGKLAGVPYPACLSVLIEHENGMNPEEELWKLLMFRSPLKVVIFYDHGDDDQWLRAKLRELFKIGEETDASWSEERATEYLFVVGRRPVNGQVPHWFYCVVQPSGFRRSYGDVLSRLC